MNETEPAGRLGSALCEGLGLVPGAIEGAMRNFATACAFRDHAERAAAAEVLRATIRAEVAAEQERCARLCREYAAQTAITEFQRHTAEQLAAAIEGPNVGIERLRSSPLE